MSNHEISHSAIVYKLKQFGRSKFFREWQCNRLITACWTGCRDFKHHTLLLTGLFSFALSATTWLHLLENQLVHLLLVGIFFTLGLFTIFSFFNFFFLERRRPIRQLSIEAIVFITNIITIIIFITVIIISCLVVTCADPGTPQHGSTNSTGPPFSYLSMIFYKCNDGYILYGSDRRSCVGEGNWTGVQPFCVGK